MESLTRSLSGLGMAIDNAAEAARIGIVVDTPRLLASTPRRLVDAVSKSSSSSSLAVEVKPNTPSGSDGTALAKHTVDKESTSERGPSATGTNVVTGGGGGERDRVGDKVKRREGEGKYDNGDKDYSAKQTRKKKKKAKEAKKKATPIDKSQTKEDYGRLDQGIATRGTAVGVARKPRVKNDENNTQALGMGEGSDNSTMRKATRREEDSNRAYPDDEAENGVRGVDSRQRVETRRPSISSTVLQGLSSLDVVAERTRLGLASAVETPRRALQSLADQPRLVSERHTARIKEEATTAAGGGNGTRRKIGATMPASRHVEVTEKTTQSKEKTDGVGNTAAAREATRSKNLRLRKEMSDDESVRRALLDQQHRIMTFTPAEAPEVATAAFAENGHGADDARRRAGANSTTANPSLANQGRQDTVRAGLSTEGGATTLSARLILGATAVDTAIEDARLALQDAIIETPRRLVHRLSTGAQESSGSGSSLGNIPDSSTTTTVDLSFSPRNNNEADELDPLPSSSGGRRMPQSIFGKFSFQRSRSDGSGGGDIAAQNIADTVTAADSKDGDGATTEPEREAESRTEPVTRSGGDDEKSPPPSPSAAQPGMLQRSLTYTSSGIVTALGATGNAAGRAAEGVVSTPRMLLSAIGLVDKGDGKNGGETEVTAQQGGNEGGRNDDDGDEAADVAPFSLVRTCTVSSAPPTPRVLKTTPWRLPNGTTATTIDTAAKYGTAKPSAKKHQHITTDSNSGHASLSTGLVIVDGTVDGVGDLINGSDDGGDGGSRDGDLLATSRAAAEGGGDLKTGTWYGENRIGKDDDGDSLFSFMSTMSSDTPSLASSRSEGSSPGANLVDIARRNLSSKDDRKDDDCADPLSSRSGGCGGGGKKCGGRRHRQLSLSFLPQRKATRHGRAKVDTGAPFKDTRRSSLFGPDAEASSKQTESSIIAAANAATTLPSGGVAATGTIVRGDVWKQSSSRRKAWQARDLALPPPPCAMVVYGSVVSVPPPPNSDTAEVARTSVASSSSPGGSDGRAAVALKKQPSRLKFSRRSLLRRSSSISSATAARTVERRAGRTVASSSTSCGDNPNKVLLPHHVRGTLALTSETVVLLAPYGAVASSKPPHGNVFVVSTPGRRLVRLDCRTAGERDAWVAALRERAASLASAVTDGRG